MIHQQDLLEQKVLSLQQLVQQLTINSITQRQVFKKTSASAIRIPTIPEEKIKMKTTRNKQPSPEQAKSKGLKRFLKNIRSFFRRVI